jgi:single-strand DNA-binding protein
MYLNEAQVSLTGYVATQPTTKMVKSGAMNLSMRVAWTPRRQDRVTGEWTDGNTSYATVICWRKLATNAGVCLRKGDPVMVKGRLAVRTYEDKQGLQRTAVEIEASSVGHDLSRGVAQFQRVRPQTGMTASEFAASNGGSIPGGDSDHQLAANGHPNDMAGVAGGADDPLVRLPGFAGSDNPHEAEDPFFQQFESADGAAGDEAAGDGPAGDGAAADGAEVDRPVSVPF